ncbi:MAG: hypothetical protein OXD34_01295 [bacterium]|nr:hypothetical protein [bacterium]
MRSQGCSARKLGQQRPPPEKVLLRVFVHFYGDRIVLLLGGYDKGRYPQKKRQQREIARARKSLRQFKRLRRLRR